MRVLSFFSELSEAHPLARPMTCEAVKGLFPPRAERGPTPPSSSAAALGAVMLALATLVQWLGCYACVLAPLASETAGAPSIPAPAETAEGTAG